MTVLWMILGAVVGGGLGWLLGRFNSRQRRECSTPT
jgi:membrane protein DedA with SNARE-associated domain